MDLFFVVYMFWENLVEILQYTENLENFLIPASTKMKQVCIWCILETRMDYFETWCACLYRAMHNR
jgi:hypothetical protein